MTRFALIAIVILIASCRGPNKHNNKQNADNGNTKVVMKWDTINYILERSSATLENENLRIYIEQNPDSVSNYAIEIFQLGKRFSINVRQPWSLTDCAYVNPRFIILEKEIKLDKPTYQKNEIVSGELDLVMLGHKDYFREVGEMKLREDWDTVLCSGVFRSVIR